MSSSSPSISSASDISYWGILRNGIPSILNNAAAPTALLLNLAIFSRTGGPTWMAAYAAVQSTVAFCQGMFNFLLYVPMAQIAHAVGQKRHQEVKSRVMFALFTGIVLGVICTACLCWSVLGWSCLVRARTDCSTKSGGFVLQIMNIARDVRLLAVFYLWGRIPSILLVFVNRVCTGILVGKQRVQLVTIINVLTSVLDVFGNATVLLLRQNQGTIFQAGLATSAATIVGTVLLLPLSIYLAAPNAEAKEHGNAPTASRMEEEEEEHPFSVLEFISSSLNMIARSILLQGAVYALSILASRMGTPVLAANQVVTQLWTLISFCCDGFADVGTMVGARLLGAGKHKEVMILTRRLFFFAVMAGTTCGSVLLLFQDSIIDSFTATDANDDTKTILRSVWMLTALMQPVNALVFVSDGLLFAHQAFGFIRNLMLIGVLGIFVPSLWLGYSTTDTLLALWIAKSLLSFWRCLAAFCFCWMYQREHCNESAPGEDMVPTERSTLLP